MVPRPSRGGGLLARNYEPITIVRAGPHGDIRIQVQGLVQTDKAIFPVDTDVTEGDVIEKSLPTGGTKAYRASRVTVHNAPGVPVHAHHVTAEIEPAGMVRPSATPRRITLPGLHPAVSAAAGALFVDGHYSRAVFAAFQAVEHAVQQTTGLATSGVPVMHQAFNPKAAKINVRFPR
jgi:hypothetical protein